MPDDDARAAFRRGGRLFDEGSFFAAHEAWEERWLVEKDPTARRTLQGLIQVAAGFHKLLVRGDRASAARLLAKGLAKLDSCEGGIPGVSLGRFREGVSAFASSLEAGDAALPAVPKVGL